MHADQYPTRRLITRTATTIVVGCLWATFLAGSGAQAQSGGGGMPARAPDYQMAKAPQRRPANGQGAQKGSTQPAGIVSVRDWFAQYDQIRRQAQMSPAERQRADDMMSKGLSLVVPGAEKTSTQALLNIMVARYKRACDQLSKLPDLGPTSNLHHSYYNYFRTAGQLFGDYVRVQDSLFATDAAGEPLAAGLMDRKKSLEALEHQCKVIDDQTRAQYSIAPYTF